MAKYEYTGTVTEILPVRTYGRNNIQCVEFRCKEPPVGNSRWENELPFVIHYDPTSDKWNNLSQVKDIHVGDEIKFSFTMRGRKWPNPNDGTVRLFVDNKVCSKIEVVGGAADGGVDNKPTTTREEAGTGDDAEMPF